MIDCLVGRSTLPSAKVYEDRLLGKYMTDLVYKLLSVK